MLDALQLSKDNCFKRINAFAFVAVIGKTASELKYITEGLEETA
jgi:hypothetical protein